MRFVFYSHGGIAGFINDFKLVDTELKKIVVVNQGCYERELFYKANELMCNALFKEHRIPNIDEFPWYMKHDFKADISLLECFLPGVEVKSNELVCFDDINHEIYISTEKVPFRHITLNMSNYIENPALSAKIRRLFEVY